MHPIKANTKIEAGIQPYRLNKLCQYRVFYITKRKGFLEAKKRTVPSRQVSPIFGLLWVADQDPGFSISQTITRFNGYIFRDYCFRFYRWLTLQEATEMKFNWWILRRLIWKLMSLGWKQPLLITPGIYSIVIHGQIFHLKHESDRITRILWLFFFQAPRWACFRLSKRRRKNEVSDHLIS